MKQNRVLSGVAQPNCDCLKIIFAQGLQRDVILLLCIFKPFDATFSEGSVWTWRGSDMFAAEEENGQDVPADQDVLIRWASKDGLIMLIDCSTPPPPPNIPT
ncbi:hypothetical protein TrispH2_008053 [Trichoplax sp. H2]|nr:hypothetical protein TrispH2_008053 [Trichoplax sp. H2]|eukprot:RDD40805.1 hypothetical protein TrispH2_008053 [Trichoplax sp. H2]